MARRYKDEPYFPALAEKMVRTGLDPVEAAEELDLNLTPQDLKGIDKSPVFKAHLGFAQVKIYREIGTDPKRDKDYLIGMGISAAEKLMADSQYKDAMDVILKVAKLMGLVGEDTNINLVGGISPSEFQSILETAKKKAEPKFN